MTVTVLDSTDLTGILADAGVTLDQPETGTGQVAKNPEGGEETTAPVVKPTEPEDEDENGLTEAERKELTAKMQKAVGKKHRQLKEAEEFAAAQYNERRLAEQREELLRQELEALKKNAAPAPKPEDAVPEAPQRQNFANENDYVDAMIQYGVDKRLAEKAEEDRKASEQRARDQVLEAAKSRVARAAELVPDFTEVVGSIDTEVPHAVAGYMQKSEMFAELAYHLAQNPDLLVSLAKLAPDEQLVKIGRIESTLSPFEPKEQSKAAQHDDTSSNAESNGKAAKAAPSTDTGIDLSKPRSKPAPVITPLDSGGNAGISKNSQDMNIRESIEDYAKRNRVNLDRRKRH